MCNDCGDYSLEEQPGFALFSQQSQPSVLVPPMLSPLNLARYDAKLWVTLMNTGLYRHIEIRENHPRDAIVGETVLIPPPNFSLQL